MEIQLAKRPDIERRWLSVPRNKQAAVKPSLQMHSIFRVQLGLGYSYPQARFIPFNAVSGSEKGKGSGMHET